MKINKEKKSHGILKRTVLLFAVLILGSFFVHNYISSSMKSRASSIPGVPALYEATYKELDAELDRFNATLDPNANADVIYGAELLSANANRKTDLLKSTSVIGTTQYLDKLKSLGVKGVSISVSYPILAANYPRSDEYLDYYKKIVDEVRKRGLTLYMDTGPSFVDPEYIKLKENGGDLDDYFDRRKEQSLLILKELKPDYLSIGTEVMTESLLVGKKITPDQYIAFINETMTEAKNVQSGTKANTQVGAGAGNWDSIEYAEKLAKTDVDFINIHIYPLGTQYSSYLERAVKIIEMAKANNKPVTIGEMWLYKASKKEVASLINPSKLFARDAYSFWHPLDVKFLKTMANLAETYEVEYVSPFWAKYFFAYLDYKPEYDKMSPFRVMLTSEVETLRSIVRDRYSETGEAYKEIIQSKR